jgi:hypothetical protein
MDRGESALAGALMSQMGRERLGVPDRSVAVRQVLGEIRPWQAGCTLASEGRDIMATVEAVLGAKT